MTDSKAAELLKIEIACIKNQDSCKHNCAECDLTRDNKALLEMYDYALSHFEASAEYIVTQKTIFGKERSAYKCDNCGKETFFAYDHCIKCGFKMKNGVSLND